jgi:catechol 2,3-dioxygenase-like lactoylglutathione lyase family enzyme
MAALACEDAVSHPEEVMSMLNSAPIMAFVATKNPDKAKAFYQHILKLKLTADDPFALVFDVNGIMLRVSKVQELSPAPFTVLGWKVADIAAEIKELKDRGVTFEIFRGFQQDDLGVNTFPSGAKVAWFKDPDGNLLSLTEFPL